MEYISYREFARRLKVDLKTIQRAVSSNKIKDGAIIEDGKKKIIYETALHECNLLGIGAKNRVIIEGLSSKQNDAKENKVDGNQKDHKIINGIGGLNKDSTYADALRMEKIFKAQLACLDSEEKNKVLVNRDEVYSTLFDFGNQIKSKMLNIADRITDDLIALSNDRDDFYSLLSKSIEDELQILSEIE